MQVAEFFSKVRKVPALNGVEDFVGFFEGIFADGVEGLLAIPGAAVRGTKARHDRDRLLK